MLKLIISTLLVASVGAQLGGGGTGQVQCQLDVALAIDGSGSIWKDLPRDQQDQGRMNWDAVRNFAATLVQDLIGTGTNTHVAAVQFEDADDTKLHFNLNQLPIAEMVSRLRNLVYDERNNGGATRTDVALQIIDKEVFTDGNAGDRGTAPNVAIIVTDGMTTSGHQTTALDLVNSMKARGVSFIAVGVGSDVNIDELNAIASSPQSVFTVSQFMELETLLLQITREACRVIVDPSQPPPPTVGPPTPPTGCPSPRYTVAFSAYSDNNGMILYANQMTIPFRGIVLNIGSAYDPNSNIFTCPCRGIYEFHLTLSRVGDNFAAAIVQNGQVVSPLAYTGSFGSVSTTTIILCNPGDQVYAQVILGGNGMMECLLEGNSFHGFSGNFISTIN